ncbi:MAG: hypothetical protein ABIY55_28760 [Kofleriaceae bacterium]
MEDTLKQNVSAVLGIIGFGVAMALRDEFSSFSMRALVAGIAGVLLWAALSRARRSSSRS